MTADRPGVPPPATPQSDTDGRVKTWTAAAVLLGIAAIAAVFAISLIGPHPLDLGTNRIAPTPSIGVVLQKKKPTCIRQAEVPTGADVVRVYAGSMIPTIRPIHLELSSAGRRLTEGTSEPSSRGWLEIPLRSPTTEGRDQVACVLSPGRQPVVLAGGLVQKAAGRAKRVGFAMTFQQSSPAGIFNWARAVIRRYGLEQLAPFGSWSLLLAALLSLMAGALALWVLIRDPTDRRPALPRHLARIGSVSGVPLAAWACALVALLNGAAWSLVVPTLAGGDERDHVAYVQHLAETGSPPSGRTARAYSAEERNLLKGLEIQRINHAGVEERPFVSSADHERLMRLAARGGDRTGEGGSSNATNNPPAYYAVEAVAYRLTSWTGLFNRIHAMRLVSAFLGALTVLFVFLFLRELLPRVPWAWSMGSLAVAFVPLFGEISGTVKEDNLAFAASAGLLLSLAVAFRRGLTARRGLAIGAFAALGALSRLAVFGLLPGVGVALGVMLYRAASERRREAIRGALVAAAMFAIPVLIYALLSKGVWDRSFLTGHPGGHTFGKPVATGVPVAHTLSGFFSYLWQFYLPSLPGMDLHFPGYQLRYIWFEPFVGRFGYGAHELPAGVFTVAFALYAAVILLAVRELIIRRKALRARLGELISYSALLIGVLLVVHRLGYTTRVDQRGEVTGTFEQVRYLFPLLGLYAALIALAVRGDWPRFGRPAGILLICMAIALSFAAQMTSVLAFYG